MKKRGYLVIGIAIATFIMLFSGYAFCQDIDDPGKVVSQKNEIKSSEEAKDVTKVDSESEKTHDAMKAVSDESKNLASETADTAEKVISERKSIYAEEVRLGKIPLEERDKKDIEALKIREKEVRERVGNLPPEERKKVREYLRTEVTEMLEKYKARTSNTEIVADKVANATNLAGYIFAPVAVVNIAANVVGFIARKFGRGTEEEYEKNKNNSIIIHRKMFGEVVKADTIELVVKKNNETEITFDVSSMKDYKAEDYKAGDKVNLVFKDEGSNMVLKVDGGKLIALTIEKLDVEKPQDPAAPAVPGSDENASINL